MLELQKVTFGYDHSIPVLRDVSMRIGAGEFVAVVGRNGSGKTTVTRMMMALKKPSQGRVTLHDADMAQAAPADMARYVGYVFQNPDRQMFRDTVEREVAYGPEQLGFPRDEARLAVEEALRLTGITALAGSYPMTLSKGQKQRVAIASALAMRPEMLILDEPTSGQDARERRRLMELLSDLNRQGVAIVLVTHDMELVARYARRVIVMAQGTVAFDGSTESLFDGTRPLSEWGLTAAKGSADSYGDAPSTDAATPQKGALPPAAPLTKILFTLAISVWSLVLTTMPPMTALLMVLLALLAAVGHLGRMKKSLAMLAVFAGMLVGFQYAFGSTVEFSLVTGMRMMIMTLAFVLLLATTSLQHMTAALVNQCRIPQEYAFMFTAALRFVPDFFAESRAVLEAQMCRGYVTKRNIFRRLPAYVALVEPLVLRAVSRSETMALSLALRGFGGGRRATGADTALGAWNGSLLAGMGAITATLVIMRLGFAY